MLSAATSAAPRSRSAGTSHSFLRGRFGNFLVSIMSRATRSANTSPSSNEFDARRLAPGTPVRETSPHAYRRLPLHLPRGDSTDAPAMDFGGRADRIQMLSGSVA